MWTLTHPSTSLFCRSTDHELDKAVIHKRPSFPTDYFTHDSASLLQGVLAKNPDKRLGCGGKEKKKVVLRGRDFLENEAMAEHLSILRTANR